jgi:hypothetical protein
VRLTAQHVRTLQATRRRATLVATIRNHRYLTDDAVLMFDRLLGQMFRREQNSGRRHLKRNRHHQTAKLVLPNSAALLAAEISGGDIGAAVEAAIDGMISAARSMKPAS